MLFTLYKKMVTRLAGPILLMSIVILVLLSANFGLLKFQGKVEVVNGQTASHLTDKNFVLINTTGVDNCSEFYRNNNDHPINQINSTFGNGNSTFDITPGSGIQNNDNDTITSSCPFLKIVYPFDCSTDRLEVNEIMCRFTESESQNNIDEEGEGDDDNDGLNKTEASFLRSHPNNNNNNNSDSKIRIYDPRSEDILDNEIFDEDGLLVVDTRFGKQYSYQLADPLNPNRTLEVNLDLAEHSQGHLNDINSPRIEIERKSLNGSLDMTAAKNQMIIWKGNVLDYFEEPEDDYENETYIEMMFNTGFHNSDAPDNERRGIGVVFDVSKDSNPYILDYRDDGKYVKLTMNDVKNLSGSDFVFHSNDNKSDNYYLNDLINKTNVTLKIKTFLTSENNRVIQTYIDPGMGKEILYWTLNNVSKLQAYEGIEDKAGFIETVNQGSGFTYVRTDNIETRLASLQSIILDPKDHRVNEDFQNQLNKN